MPSNFLKRKAKEVIGASTEQVEETAQEQPQEELEATVAEAVPPYNQEAYDIFTSDGGRTYHVAEIAYNPETMQAVVSNIFDISRLVALSYQNQKQALGTLKKGKK